MGVCYHIVTLLLVATYLGSGVLFYSLHEGWDPLDALYFSMVTMSTVGYGDLSPSTTTSRCFTGAFILVGIVLVFTRLVSETAGLMHRFEDFVLYMIDFTEGNHNKHLLGDPKGFDGNTVDLDHDGIDDMILAPAAFRFWAQHLTCSFITFNMLQLASAAVFTLVQPDTEFLTALYHCWVTATTVGYGDVSLQDGARILAFFHIALSVTWLAAFLARLDELRQFRRHQLARDELIARQLDQALLQDFDVDGQGVCKLEYVVGMLIQLRCEIGGVPLSWRHVQPFILRFDALDTNGDGVLNKSDIDALERERLRKCEILQQKAEAQLSPVDKAQVWMARKMGMDVQPPVLRKVNSGFSTSAPETSPFSFPSWKRLHPRPPEEALLTDSESAEGGPQPVSDADTCTSSCEFQGLDNLGHQSPELLAPLDLRIFAQQSERHGVPALVRPMVDVDVGMSPRLRPPSPHLPGAIKFAEDASALGLEAG